MLDIPLQRQGLHFPTVDSHLDLFVSPCTGCCVALRCCNGSLGVNMCELVQKEWRLYALVVVVTVLLLRCCCYGVVVTILLVCFCGGQSRWMDMPQRANVPSKPPGPHRRHPLRNINFLSPSHIRIENSGILRTLTISSSAKVGWLTQRIGQRARTEEHSAKLLVSSTAKTEAPFWRPFGGIAHDPRE